MKKKYKQLNQLLKSALNKNLLIFTLLYTNLIFAQEPNLEWVHGFGGKGVYIRGQSISIGSDGYLYSTGTFISTSDFDPGPNTFKLPPGKFFIQKLDLDGNFVWAKGMVGNDYNFPQSITTDSDGNVYTTGWFQGLTDFDPGPDSLKLSPADGSRGIFIQKLDAEGNLVWAKAFDEFYSSGQGFSLTTDLEGNLYITGTFNGTIDFDPGTSKNELTSSKGLNGYSDIFILKLDTDGNFVWAKAIGEGGYDNGLSITTDLNGNVYTTGFFERTVDFNPDPNINYPLSSKGGSDIFILKLDADGNFVWAKAMGSSDAHDRGNSIQVDSEGNVFTTGSFGETADFDPGAGPFELSSDKERNYFSQFIQKLDADGNFVWAKAMGGIDDYIYKYSIVLDSEGNIFTTGAFSGTVDFDPGVEKNELTSNGNKDIFILKLDTEGNFEWVETFGGKHEDYSKDIAIDTNGKIYTIGKYEDTIDFDPGKDTFAINEIELGNIFLLKMGQCASSSIDTVILCNGNYKWIDGITYTESNNTATYTTKNAAGCDSVIHLDLTIQHIIVEGATLTAETEGATYQWIDCDNEQNPISGATGQSFTPTKIGNYGVIISKHGCTDTLDCVMVSGLDEHNFLENIIVYPNPSINEVTIDIGEKVKEMEIKVINLTGQVVNQKTVENTSTTKIELNGAPGIYFIEIKTLDYFQGQYSRVTKLVKN